MAYKQLPSDDFLEEPDETTTTYVDTTNEFIVQSGENMANHTMSMGGRSRYVIVGGSTRRIEMRTKQQAYRLCAYVLALSDTLPDEDVPSSYKEVVEAINNV